MLSEIRKLQIREWQKANPEKVKAAKQRYYATAKGKEQKRKEDKAYVASGGRAAAEKRRAEKPLSEARKQARLRWAKRNPEYYAANRGIRRSLFSAASDFDKFVYVEAMKLARLRKRLFGFSWHVDHIVPVSKSGTSGANNLQVVPATWNQRKSNKHTNRYFGISRA